MKKPGLGCISYQFCISQKCSPDPQTPSFSPLRVPDTSCFHINYWCYLQKFIYYSQNLMSFIFSTWSEENRASQMIKPSERALYRVLAFLDVS